MTTPFRVMRGSIAERDKLIFPYMATPKLDGVRAYIRDGVVYSKSNKPIPNAYIQKILGVDINNGLDGELIVGDPTHPMAYRRTTSAVRRVDGRPAFKFHVFDAIDFNIVHRATHQIAIHRYHNTGTFIHNWSREWGQKFIGDGIHKNLNAPSRRKKNSPRYLKLVPMQTVYDINELDRLEAKYLALGYEGLMLRNPTSPYKQGVATVKENYLLKLKRFDDAEAKIIDWVEFNHNDNPPYIDELGFQKRSSSKAGKRPGNKLGKFIVEGLNGPFKGKTFEIGVGYTDAERKNFWRRRRALKGQALTYRSQRNAGGYNLPRLPVFAGLRMAEDMALDE